MSLLYGACTPWEYGQLTEAITDACEAEAAFDLDDLEAFAAALATEAAEERRAEAALASVNEPAPDLNGMPW